MKSKSIIYLYIAAALLIVVLIVIYRRYILPESWNSKIDDMTIYKTPYLQTAAKRFNEAVLSASFKSDADYYKTLALNKKNIYQDIANRVNPAMPWYFIAALHMRESGMNFNTHLHNGDSLTKRTVRTPSNRPSHEPAAGTGKPYSFTESATDALTQNGKELDKWTDWSIPGMIYLFEKYNGWGYKNKGLVSPYVWSGSQFYTSGKYVQDGIYSNTTIDKQLGAAILVKYLNPLLKA